MHGALLAIASVQRTWPVRNPYDEAHLDLVLPLKGHFQAVRDGDGALLNSLTEVGHEAVTMDSGITVKMNPPQLLNAIGLWAPTATVLSSSPGWPLAISVNGKPLANATINGELDVSFGEGGQLPTRYIEDKAASSLLVGLSPARRVDVVHIRSQDGRPAARLDGLMLFRYCEPIRGCSLGAHKCSNSSAGGVQVECTTCEAEYYQRHGKCRRCPALDNCRPGSLRCSIGEWEAFPKSSTCEVTGCKPGHFGIYCQPCNRTACGNFSCTRRADNCDSDTCAHGYLLQRGLLKNTCVAFSGPTKCRGLECSNSWLARVMKWFASEVLEAVMPWASEHVMAFGEQVRNGYKHQDCGLFAYPTLFLPSLLCVLLFAVLKPRLKQAEKLVAYAGAYGRLKAIPHILFGFSWQWSVTLAGAVSTEWVQRQLLKVWSELAPPTLQRLIEDELPGLADDLQQCLNDRSMRPMFGVVFASSLALAASVAVLIWRERRRDAHAAAAATAADGASAAEDDDCKRELKDELKAVDELLTKLQDRKKRIQELLLARK